MPAVKIIIRSIHGKQHIFEGSWDEAYLWSLRLDEDDEILLVLVDGACAYSQLCSIDSLSKDDLTGFFA